MKNKQTNDNNNKAKTNHHLSHLETSATGVWQVSPPDEQRMQSSAERIKERTKAKPKQKLRNGNLRLRLRGTVLSAWVQIHRMWSGNEGSRRTLEPVGRLLSKYQLRLRWQCSDDERLVRLVAVYYKALHFVNLLVLQVTQQMKKLKQSYGAPTHSSNAGRRNV